MTWQDAVLTVGALVLLAAMVPLVIIIIEKPPWYVAFMFGTVLGCFGAVYCSYGAYWGAAVTWMQAILWYVIAGQGVRNRREQAKS